MALDQVLTGNFILAVDIQDEIDELDSYARPIQVVKSGDTARTSTAARTADPHLSITLPPNRTYDCLFTGKTFSAANAAGDFAWDVIWTNTATVTVGGNGLTNVLASGSVGDMEGASFVADSTTPAGGIPWGTSTSTTDGQGWFRVVTGSSAVVVTIGWAQFASNVNSTTLRAGSTLVARRIA